METADRASSSLLIVRTILSRILWFGVIGGAIAGAVEGASGLYLATSAPQQAAAAGISCVWAADEHVSM
jgi:hypothetical protein